MKSSRRNPAKNPPGNTPPGGTALFRRWFADKAPLLFFGLKFCALTALFYLVLLLPFCQRIILASTVADARLSGLVLNLIGQRNHVEGAVLCSGDRSVITVSPACSGFDFLCFFCAAVLVFPVPFRKKIAGVLIGIPLLLALNLVRIMSLYFVGIHYPRVFDLLHEEIWAIILVAASIMLYIAWMRWAGTPNLREADVTA